MKKFIFLKSTCRLKHIEGYEFIGVGRNGMFYDKRIEFFHDYLGQLKQFIFLSDPHKCLSPETMIQSQSS